MLPQLRVWGTWPHLVVWEIWPYLGVWGMWPHLRVWGIWPHLVSVSVVKVHVGDTVTSEHTVSDAAAVPVVTVSFHVARQQHLRFAPVARQHRSHHWSDL